MEKARTVRKKLNCKVCRKGAAQAALDTFAADGL
jgi:hypothetical protein